MNFLACAGVGGVAIGAGGAAAGPGATAAGAGAGFRGTMQEGDLVIVYENFNSMKAVYVDAKATFENRFGSFPQKVGGGLGWGGAALSVLLPPPLVCGVGVCMCVCACGGEGPCTLGWLSRSRAGMQSAQGVGLVARV